MFVIYILIFELRISKVNTVALKTSCISIISGKISFGWVNYYTIVLFCDLTQILQTFRNIGTQCEFYKLLRILYSLRHREEMVYKWQVVLLILIDNYNSITYHLLSAVYAIHCARYLMDFNSFNPHNKFLRLHLLHLYYGTF